MATISLEQEINPWEAQAARFDFAARKLNLDEGLWRVLRYPSREIIVHFPVAMDDGRIEMFTGFRVLHSQARGPRPARHPANNECRPCPVRVPANAIRGNR